MVVRSRYISENGSTGIGNPQQAYSSLEWPKVVSRFENRTTIPEYMRSGMEFLLADILIKDGSILESDEEVIGF